MFKIKILILSLLLALAGCTSLAPDYQRPKLPVPQHFSVNDTKDNKQPPTAGLQNTGWRAFSLTLS